MFNDTNPALASGMGLASLLATIRGLYPNAQVTSGYRGPNNPLTQRNPASLHARGSPQDPRAVDVAPIPGMSFDQYVSSVKNAGVPISQAFDEAKHPFPWTTGPNWHLASGTAPMAARKPKTLADLASPPLSTPPINGEQPSNLGQSPMTLAGLASPQIPDVPTKKPSPFTAGNILGVLGDALMAYGGLPPQFAPALRHQREDDKQAELARERLATEVQLAQKKAMEPPQWLQDATIFNRLPDQQKQTVLDYRNAMFPVVADFQGPDGSVVRRAVPRQLPPRAGAVEDGYVFLGGDPADPSNWRAQ
jgi:hypothetical protein